MTVRVLQEWVGRRADARPDARAIVDRDGALTYGELERLSNRLAWALRDAGCERGDRVAFLLPRSSLAVATLVGILKADCIYVPLDSRSPGRRLATIVDRCEPRVVLADAAEADRLLELGREGAFRRGVRLGWMSRAEPPRRQRPPVAAEGAVLREGDGVAGELPRPAFTLADIERLPDERPRWRNGPGDPAYILFTSGSTGTPKGVVITHGNVVTFIAWAVDHFGLGPSDRLGGYTRLTFDLSTFDIHATFAAGAELHIVPEALKLLPPRMLDFMRRARLTHWLSVPSLLDYVARFDALEANDLPAMKRVTWCGDVFPTPSLLYWMERLPHASFTNLYGPTETTVASSYYTVPRGRLDPAVPIPIGRACTGEELLILDEDLHPVATGERGYLYIRGAGSSPGYWRDEERTREAFIPDPFHDDPESRIYRTGDLARFDEEGNVHFLGREDQQIKTRGYRVELGEVESALRSLPEMAACAAVGIRTSGFEGAVIGCAYVASNGGPVAAARVRSYLTELLPDYMIPTKWMPVDRLPLNDRGKVDRRRIREMLEEA